MKGKNWGKASDTDFLRRLRKGDKVYIADSYWGSLNNKLCIVTKEADVGGDIRVSSLVPNDIKRGIGQDYFYPCMGSRYESGTISLWDPKQRR